MGRGKGQERNEFNNNDDDDARWDLSGNFLRSCAGFFKKGSWCGALWGYQGRKLWFLVLCVVNSWPRQVMKRFAVHPKFSRFGGGSYSGTGVGSSAESRVRTFFIVLLLPLREDFLDRADRLVPLRSLAAGVESVEFLPWSLDRFRVMTSPPSLSEESSSYSSSPLSSGCSRSGV